jgi:hypothetical protein
MAICELCQREVHRTTRHHLIPRLQHNKKRNRREFTREEVNTRIAHLCSLCHRQLHKVFDHKTLERELNTLEALLNRPEIQSFLVWARKQR